MLPRPIRIGVVDTETTGLKQEEGHRIIEVALSILVTADGYTFNKIGDTWTQRINPLRAIDKAAEAVHGISLADLRGMPEWEEVAPRISQIFGKLDLVVAHNAEFDMPFIALELMRVGLPIPKVDVFCTMLNGRKATAMGKVPSLKELCFAMGVDYDEGAAHAADYDTECLVQCFTRGVQYGFFQLPMLQPVELKVAC